MRTITKKELVNRIAEKTTVTKVVAKDIIQSFLDAIIEELAAGNRLEFREFGVFETKERAARIAQNPKTLQRVQVPPKRTVKFKVGRLMKQKLQEGIQQPQAAAQPPAAAPQPAVAPNPTETSPAPPEDPPTEPDPSET